MTASDLVCGSNSTAHIKHYCAAHPFTFKQSPLDAIETDCADTPDSHNVALFDSGVSNAVVGGHTDELKHELEIYRHRTSTRLSLDLASAP